MLACLVLILAPIALACLFRAAPHVVLLVPTIGALAGLAALASALPG